MKLLAILLSSLLITSCSLSGSSDVNYERYSLVEDTVPAAFNTDYGISLDLYGVLKDGGVVLQTSDVSLRPAKNHRWASDLASQLKILLTQELINNGVNTAYKFNVTVTKFQGDLVGNVYISANCIVFNGKNQILDKNIVYKAKQDDDGYDALVAKLKEGWVESSKDLANEVLAR